MHLLTDAGANLPVEGDDSAGSALTDGHLGTADPGIPDAGSRGAVLAATKRP